MYVVSVLYPRHAPGDRFDLEHYVDVHLKLGWGLMHKHFGVTPERAIVLHTTQGLDGSATSARYLSICFVCFKSEQAASLFAKVFAIDEAAQALQADWANYCAGPPEIICGDVLELSGTEIMSGAQEVLERHACMRTAPGSTT